MCPFCLSFLQEGESSQCEGYMYDGPGEEGRDHPQHKTCPSRYRKDGGGPQDSINQQGPCLSCGVLGRVTLLPFSAGSGIVCGLRLFLNKQFAFSSVPSEVISDFELWPIISFDSI